MLGSHGELYDTESRPLESLDNGFEKLIQRRLARFHGSLIERTQFDQETLEKQLDLEVITITLEDEKDEMKKEFTELGQCVNQPYSRKIFREDNEEGRCMRLYKDLSDIAKEYGVDEEKCFELFE
jgi:hypothetical protein